MRITAGDFLKNRCYYGRFLKFLRLDKKKAKALKRGTWSETEWKLIHDVFSTDESSSKKEKFLTYIGVFKRRILRDLKLELRDESVVPIYTRWENIFVDSMLGVILRHKKKAMDRSEIISRFEKNHMKISRTVRSELYSNFLNNVYRKAQRMSQNRKTTSKQTFLQCIDDQFNVREAEYLRSLNKVPDLATRGMNMVCSSDSVGDSQAQNSTVSWKIRETTLKDPTQKSVDVRDEAFFAAINKINFEEDTYMIWSKRLNRPVDEIRERFKYIWNKSYKNYVENIPHIDAH